MRTGRGVATALVLVLLLLSGWGVATPRAPSARALDYCAYISCASGTFSISNFRGTYTENYPSNSYSVSDTFSGTGTFTIVIPPAGTSGFAYAGNATLTGTESEESSFSDTSCSADGSNCTTTTCSASGTWQISEVAVADILVNQSGDYFEFGPWTNTTSYSPVIFAGNSLQCSGRALGPAGDGSIEGTVFELPTGYFRPFKVSLTSGYSMTQAMNGNEELQGSGQASWTFTLAIRSISQGIGSVTTTTSSNSMKSCPSGGWSLSLQGSRVVQSTSYTDSFAPTETIAIDGTLTGPDSPLGCPLPDVSLTVTYSPPDGKSFSRGVPVTGSVSGLAAPVTVGILYPSDIANRGGLWNVEVSGSITVGGTTVPVSARLSFIVSAGVGQMVLTSQGQSTTIRTYGNMTSMSSPTFSKSNGKYELNFTATGTAGTTGYTTLVVPKSLVPEGYQPAVYIDGKAASIQKYSQDSTNYYISVTTHFSTHSVEVLFSPQLTNTASSSSGPLETGLIAGAVIIGVSLAAVVLRKHNSRLLPPPPPPPAA